MICAVGFPLPEEVIILSAGILGHMSLHPETYPPPYEGAPSVEPYALALACLSAVIITDSIIYYLGHKFGKKLLESKWAKKHAPEHQVDRVRRWVKQYGFFAPGVFRFIPGVRFPGHLMCGALDMKYWNFVITDGIAAVISVPSQVLLVALYGEVIIDRLGQFKLIVFGTLGVLGAGYLVYKLWFKPKQQQSA